MRNVDSLVASRVIVGRDHELAALQRALEEAALGNGRCVTVAGEPGAGKSRLLAEAAQLARRDGFLLVQGLCFDSRWREIILGAGFTSFRRAAATPFNRVFEARP